MTKEATVIYDKACPACHTYCELYRDAHSDSTNLVDACEDSALMREITRCGLDIDEGMVVELDGDLYYGWEAIHLLANLQDGNHWFDRVNRLIFKNRQTAKFFYPLMKAVRNLLLKLLGIRRINNLDVPGRDRF